MRWTSGDLVCGGAGVEADGDSDADGEADGVELGGAHAEQAQQLAVGLRMGELIPMLRGAGDEAPTGLDARGDGRLACRGVLPDRASSAAAPARIAIDVLVGGRQPPAFALAASSAG